MVYVTFTTTEKHRQKQKTSGMGKETALVICCFFALAFEVFRAVYSQTEGNGAEQGECIKANHQTRAGQAAWIPRF